MLAAFFIAARDGVGDVLNVHIFRITDDIVDFLAHTAGGADVIGTEQAADAAGQRHQHRHRILDQPGPIAALFLEAVVRLEDERQEQAREENPQTEEQDGEDSANDALSDREKEVIVCVVKGMSNKEIAEQLYISVNTVMTHRRNISRKLQIHSPAGLTIYAIVNGLINLEDVKL